MTREALPVIDLFAGPGGLGEGFASLPEQFRIALSAEKDGPAHRTLQLRAFRRLLEREGRSLDSYYAYLNGHTPHPAAPDNQDVWDRAGEEALKLTLGEEADDRALYQRMDQLRLEGRPWVLVGGPPCQAYSLVGRARNRAKEGYEAEKDERHFLYKEYLKIIQHYRPAVFVMENVKGILSSRVSGERIFPKILRDLVGPDEALGRPSRGAGYRLHSLVDSNVVFRDGDDAETLPTDAFLVESERFGVPQTRHRVLILGIREDLDVMPPVLEERETVTVADVIDDLKPVRSGLSRNDSPAAWRNAVRHAGLELQREARRARERDMAGELGEVLKELDDRAPLERGGVRAPASPRRPVLRHPKLRDWLQCSRLDVCLNHEARSHMPADLGRYLYAAVFARLHDRSPIGAAEFALPGLAPEHANWVSGKFADRFRVQVADEPAKTVTSHICKDGHYYIHYQPEQCRALTVREAARIQTFPDDYFFEGNRTQQYHQVGNAVPPWLARQVAGVVGRVIEDASIQRDNGRIRPFARDEVTGDGGLPLERPAAEA